MLAVVWLLSAIFGGAFAVGWLYNESPQVGWGMFVCLVINVIVVLIGLARVVRRASTGGDE